MVERMLLKEQSVDVDLLVQRVRTTKEEAENLRKDVPEPFQKKRTRGYMDGLNGGVNFGKMV